MAWANGRMSERKADDGIGVVSVDWVVDSVTVYTYSDKIDSTKDKARFKAEANIAKDEHIARQSKQDTIGSQITNYMNS